MAPLQLDGAELHSHPERNPLVELLPLFRELLGRITTEARHLMAVGDANARLLWVEGHPVLRRRAEHMNFVEGAAWDEPAAGTSAPGTAIALNRPVQITAAEHFCEVLQPWTCSAAPIRDPHTRDILGFVDLTGGDQLGTPVSLSLVRATALAAEGELARLRAARPAGAPSPTAGSPEAGVAHLEFLGRDSALLGVGMQQLRLSRRHSEILAVLADCPEGVTGEQLGVQLYADEANPITLRAEMARLRRLLGEELLASHPLPAPHPGARRLPRAGAATREGRGGRGVPPRPRARAAHVRAPGVERLRRRVEQQVRAGLLGAADPGLLLRWTRTPWGREDLEVWELLARTSSRRSGPLARRAGGSAAHGRVPRADRSRAPPEGLSTPQARSSPPFSARCSRSELLRDGPLPGVRGQRAGGSSACSNDRRVMVGSRVAAARGAASDVVGDVRSDSEIRQADLVAERPSPVGDSVCGPLAGRPRRVETHGTCDSQVPVDARGGLRADRVREEHPPDGAAGRPRNAASRPDSAPVVLCRVLLNATAACTPADASAVTSSLSPGASTACTR